MEERTLLTRTLEDYGEKARLDKEAKKITANKRVLARILQGTVPELDGLNRNQIVSCIEDVEISETSGDRLKPKRITRPEPEAVAGMNTEDADPDSGTARFDVKFYIRTHGRPRVKIIINVEIQQDSYPGYDLVTRGVFYGCRMIASQRDVEFSGDDYDSLKKVYSIWLCLEAPKVEADTITRYHLVPEAVTGKTDPNRHRYDLINVTMIWLNGRSYQVKATELHGYLGTIFSSKLKPAEKIRILDDEYGEKPTRKIKGGIYRMCNLGDAIEARGIKKGEKRGERRGEKRGERRGIIVTIKTLREVGQKEDDIQKIIMKNFGLSKSKAESYMKEIVSV